jgi:hypothetical protein
MGTFADFAITSPGDVPLGLEDGPIPEEVAESGGRLGIEARFEKDGVYVR